MNNAGLGLRGTTLIECRGKLGDACQLFAEILSGHCAALEADNGGWPEREALEGRWEKDGCVEVACIARASVYLMMEEA